MIYKCLILDHDDTSVNSTRVIHHPSHIETMRIIRPEIIAADIDTWFRKNFNPGIMEYFKDELCFSDEELDMEFKIWREFNEKSNPEFFDGIIDIVKSFQDNGGIVSVVSHSEKDIIKRHYEINGKGFMPDSIFGWDDDPEKRKPSIWPVKQIMDEYNLSSDEILMVDDLKPGLIMAKDASIKIAGAGWGHNIPEIAEYMKEHCDYYFTSVSELAKHIFEN